MPVKKHATDTPNACLRPFRSILVHLFPQFKHSMVSPWAVEESSQYLVEQISDAPWNNESSLMDLPVIISGLYLLSQNLRGVEVLQGIDSL